MPHALHVKVKEEIPAAIGVLAYHAFADQEKGSPGYFSVEKTAAAIFTVNENALLYRLISAQAREVGTANSTRFARFLDGTIVQRIQRKGNQNTIYFGGGVITTTVLIEDTQLLLLEALKRRTGCNAREALFRIEQRF